MSLCWHVGNKDVHEHSFARLDQMYLFFLMGLVLSVDVHCYVNDIIQEGVLLLLIYFKLKSPRHFSSSS